MLHFTCVIQELEKAPRVSFDPRFGREYVPARVSLSSCSL